MNSNNNTNNQQILIKALLSKNPVEFMGNLSKHNKIGAEFMEVAGDLPNMSFDEGEQKTRNFCRQNNINFDIAFKEFEKFYKQKER